MDTLTNRWSIGLRVRKIASNVALAFALFVVVSPAFFVMLWMVSLAFKNEIDNIAYPPIWIPTAPTLNNFRTVFERSPFGLYTINSIIVSGSATLIGMLVGVPAAYGIAKGKAMGMGMLVMLARITPGLSYLIPLFTLFRFLKLTGTLVPVAITHLVITVPMIVWVMISYFEDMHPELEEAALVDGCTIWRAFVSVSMPLARPGIAVAAILAFIQSWNNFIFSAVLAGRETRTLPVAVFNSMTYEQLSWGPLAAAALIVTLPSLLLTVFIQRDIVTGLAAGAVKG
jgi:multiple sugar transport system permease protein